MCFAKKESCIRFALAQCSDSARSVVQEQESFPASGQQQLELFPSTMENLAVLGTDCLEIFIRLLLAICAQIYLSALFFSRCSSVTEES